MQLLIKRYYFIALLILLSVSFFIFHCSHAKKSLSTEIIKDSLNLFYGIAGKRGTILDKKYFIINHNDTWKIPCWVAYYLTSHDLQGTTKRQGGFYPDPELPLGLRAELADYIHSGYDRGHIAPAADFKRSKDAMTTTFLLSNMSPQTPELNRKIWQKLEEQVREHVNANGKAWIVTGNLFLSNDSHFIAPSEFIGLNKVAIPTHCFKVILLCNRHDIFSMYAFMLPNQKDTIKGMPANYILRVDRLEQITGYDFFPLLNDSIESKLESVLPTNWFTQPFILPLGVLSLCSFQYP